MGDWALYRLVIGRYIVHWALRMDVSSMAYCLEGLQSWRLIFIAPLVRGVNHHVAETLGAYQHRANCQEARARDPDTLPNTLNETFCNQISMTSLRVARQEHISHYCELVYGRKVTK